MSLLELAIESTSKRDYLQEQREATLLFAGNKGVGKTTLVHLLLERNEAPKPTLALDYTFGRRSGKSLGRDVCHIWELGGGSAFTSLLSAPLAAARLEHLALVLVLDLSKPQQLWNVLESVTSTVRKLVTKLAEMDSHSMAVKLKEKAAQRLGEQTEVDDFIDPFPIPLVIIGGKYDIFQDFDTEKKKVVSRSLRYAALTLGASLYFFSSKDSGLSKKVKDLLTHLAFGTPAPKSVCQDVSKPLAIPCGVDSIQLIGGPGTSFNFKSSAAAMERWKHTYTALYPQEDAGIAEIPEDPAKDPNFSEPEIDRLRAQKDEELERYRQESSRRKNRNYSALN